MILNEKELKEMIKNVRQLQHSDYESFVQALIAIEMNITDFDGLDHIFAHYMGTDEMDLINPQFKELAQNWRRSLIPDKDQIVNLLHYIVDIDDVNFKHHNGRTYTDRNEIVIFSNNDFDTIVDVLNSTAIDDISQKFSPSGNWKFRHVNDMYLIVKTNTKPDDPFI